MDRISSLPEELINQILSFLPTEDVIKTTILSKQWRKVGSTFPNLYFNCITFKRKQKFNGFVYQTLMRHYSNTDIHKMRLDVPYDTAVVPLINEWISFALTRNLCQLVLHVYCDMAKSVKLPVCLFSCKTLTVLTLRNIVLDALPKIATFPNLKSLTLMFVRIFDENIFNLFFSSCPKLEYLQFFRCNLPYEKSITISAPKLSVLDIYKTWISNQKVHISSLTLNQITYLSGVPMQNNFETFRYMHTASFALYCIPSKSDGLIEYRFEDQFAIKILSSLPNVVKLSLLNYYIEYLVWEPDLLVRLPISSCMKHLQLEMCHTKNQFLVIKFLLRTYPNLQTLHIIVKDSYHFKTTVDMEPYFPAESLSTDAGGLKNLRTVEIKCFQGSESELSLVRHLLQNASILEKMTINYLKWKGADARTCRRIRRQIHKFPRASPYVAVLFSGVSVDFL